MKIMSLISGTGNIAFTDTQTNVSNIYTRRFIRPKVSQEILQDA